MYEGAVSIPQLIAIVYIMYVSETGCLRETVANLTLGFLSLSGVPDSGPGSVPSAETGTPWHRAQNHNLVFAKIPNGGFDNSEIPANGFPNTHGAEPMER